MLDHTIVGAAGLLLAGAITPGPNNLVVMREAARSGWRGVLAAVIGIVGGSVALLLLLSLGIGAALSTRPRMMFGASVVGCAYLAYLGLRLLVSHAPTDPDEDVAALPAGSWGLFTFQFLNPKAWVLVLTVSASVQAQRGTFAALPLLLGLFIIVPAACLTLWSLAGAALHRVSRGGTAQAWLDRGMALVLIACGLLLVV